MRLSSSARASGAGRRVSQTVATARRVAQHAGVAGLRRDPDVGPAEGARGQDERPSGQGDLLGGPGAGAVQRVVPDEGAAGPLDVAPLQGRVSSAGTMLAWGAQPLGALAGGLLAGAFGLAAPWIVGDGLRLVAAVGAMGVLREWTD